jgi:iron complex outermembrane receptor protein
MSIRNATLLLLVQGAISSVVALTPVPAAYADDIDEIVVTAQRREQKLQDVGMAISALGGERLAELGVSRGIDIVAQVPGVQVSGAGGGTTNSFSIRGVTQNAFAGSLESPIAVYEDDAYLSLNTIIALSLYDIDRVEVLRGPQGTLFGRNATGGVVRYVTARPSRTPGGTAYAEVGGDGRVRLEGGVGGPVADTMAFRLSGVFNRDDGLMKNRTGPDSMKAHDYSLRGQLLIKPNDNLNVLLKTEYLNDDSNRGGFSFVPARNGQYVADPTTTDFFGYREPDNDPYTSSTDFAGYKKDKVWNLTANVDWSLGSFTLSSVTNFQNIVDSYAEDSDVTPNSVYNYVKTAGVNQFSQELRVAYKDDRVDGLLGVYFLRIAGLYGTVQTGDIFFGGGSEIATADQVTKSYAIFGQTEIKMTDTIGVEVGARYSKDKKQYRYDSSNLFDIYQPGPITVAKNKSDDGVSARLQLNYRPRDGLLVYGGYNRGIKSGGLNFPLFPMDPALFDFKGEVLTSYEGGVKATLAPRTTLNFSVFHYKYDDYQAFSFDGLAARVVNVNAKMNGAEIEFESRPFGGLDVSLGMSYLQNTVRDVPLAVSSGTEHAAVSPKWTFNGLVGYSWPAFGGKLGAQVDGNWKSKHTFNLVPTPVLREPGYAIVNARLAYTTGDDHWTGAVFVKNLANKYYRFYSFDTSGDWGALEDTPGVPRWFGASLSYKW